jgi:hypothetical protein
MKIKKFDQINEDRTNLNDFIDCELDNEPYFKPGDMVLYEGEIAKVLRVDLPKYELLKIRIYHPTLNITETTISSTLCEKFEE